MLMTRKVHTAAGYKITDPAAQIITAASGAYRNIAQFGTHPVITAITGVLDKIRIKTGEEQRKEPRIAEEYLAAFEKASEELSENLRALAGREDFIEVINKQNSDGSTILHELAKLGEKNFLQVLIAAGADPFLPDKQGVTPFHLALVHHDAAVAEAMVMKIEVDKVASFFGKSVTSFANTQPQLSQISIPESLIACIAQTSRAEEEKYELLSKIAAETAQLGIIVQKSKPENCLKFAIAQNYKKALGSLTQDLMEKSRSEDELMLCLARKDIFGVSLLRFAHENGVLTELVGAVFQTLPDDKNDFLQKLAINLCLLATIDETSPTAYDRHCETFYDYATRDKASFSEKIRAIDDFCRASPFQFGLPHLAAVEGDTKMILAIEKLVIYSLKEKGITCSSDESQQIVLSRLDQPNSRGTPLLFAVKCGQVETVQTLVGLGCNPFKAQKAGKPIEVAINSRNPKLVVSIIDGLIEANKGEVPLIAKTILASSIASYQDCAAADKPKALEVVKAVTAKIGAEFDDLKFAADDRDSNLVSALIATDSALKCFFDEKGSFLHYLASQPESAEMIEVVAKALTDKERGLETRLGLIAEDSRPYPHLEEIMRLASSITGNTPLHLAVLNGDQEAAEALLKISFINPHRKNSDGKTALDLALETPDSKLAHALSKHPRITSSKIISGSSPQSGASQLTRPETPRTEVSAVTVQLISPTDLVISTTDQARS